MTRKDIIKMIAAILIFLFGLHILTIVLMPKWNYFGNQAQTRVQGFYHQEKNTDDVLYTGSSFAYCEVSPLQIWKEQGLTGYVFANPMQKTWLSYYYLEEALKYQSPKVVVYEVGTIMDDNVSSEEHNHKNLDYLRWSPTRLKAIAEVSKAPGESVKDYLFPLFRFHSRWSILKERDFNLSYDDSYYMMGTALKLTTIPASDTDIDKYNIWTPVSHTDVQPGKRCQEYILKMKELCEKKNIEFLLMRCPSMEWSPESSQAVKTFAAKNNLDFLDMNDCRDEIGLDWKTDSHDGGIHVNILGCAKVSSYLGSYLKEHYDFDAKHNDKTKELWDHSAVKFQSLVASYTLPTINDYHTYMKAIENEDFITAIFSEDSNSDMILMDGKDVLKDTAKFKKLALSDYAADQSGTRIVVYDKTLKQVVDSVCFHSDGKTVTHIEQPLMKDEGGE